MKKIIIRHSDDCYVGYYRILKVFLIQATRKYPNKEVVKDIFKIY